MNDEVCPLERERGLLFAVAVSCAVLGSLYLPRSRWSIAMSLIAIAVAVWHGAFDQALAREVLEPRFRARWAWFFYPAYLILAGSCVALWCLAPPVALPLFLGYSALHFGTETERPRSPLDLLAGIARGGVPIAAACYWSPLQVREIFAQMLRGQMQWSTKITTVTGALLLPCLFVAILALLLRSKHPEIGLLTLAADLCLFYFCSPVVAFAVFFCMRHTPDHLVSTSLNSRGHFQLKKMWAHLRQGVWPWLLALSAIACAGLFAGKAAMAYTGVLFIGLSALTIPHMVLAEICRSLEINPFGKAQWNIPGASV